MDLNHRMSPSKGDALPLGETPISDGNRSANGVIKVGYKVRFLSNPLTDCTADRRYEMNKLILPFLCYHKVSALSTTFLIAYFLGLHIANGEKRNCVILMVVARNKRRLITECYVR